MSRVSAVLWLGIVLALSSVVSAQSDEVLNSKDTLKQSSGWSSSITASSTFVLATERDRGAQIEIPWRPLESSQMAPQRFEAGLSYHFGHQARGRFDLGLSLFPRSSYGEGMMSLHNESFSDREEVTLGEVSATLPMASSYQLTIGRFVYRVDQLLQDDALYHVGAWHNQPLWTWEERYWSWSASPLERWVSGLSLGGVFGDASPSRHFSRDRTQDRSDMTSGTYRLSLFMPHERIEMLDNRGIVASGIVKLVTSAWRVTTHGAWGHHLALNPNTAQWADEQMVVVQNLYQRQSLASKEIRYSGFWWRGLGHVRLDQSKHNELWFQASIETRQISFGSKSTLNQLEEAALAESNSLGDGRAWGIGIFGCKRPNYHDTQSIFLQRWGIEFLSRDPHLTFAYDLRHRVRGYLKYTYIPSWGQIGVELWYTHLWSAPDNYWHVDSDIGGVTLEVGYSVF